ncbi:MAG: hypothetical protein E7672_00195 [Ruminococcaceae bacterium]|nr:hypothetical protein [Oscillospiraceae bacterium]
MKKILAIILALAMMTVSFMSCSNDQNESDNDSNNPNESVNNPDESESDDPAEESESQIEDPVTAEAPYKRVIVIGVDGAGAYFNRTDTPNIDRIFEGGAVTYEAVTATPSISAQCWGEILLGITADVHKLTNSTAAYIPYNPESIFPSIFRVVRENDPEATIASFCNWDTINCGFIEDNIGVYKTSGNDANIAQKVCDFVAENDPKLVFIQFDEVDGAGHNEGFGGEEQLEQITVTDGYIGQIYDAYAAKGYIEDTLFIVTADHGGNGNDHGGDTFDEMHVMYAAAGHTVVSGTIGEMSVRDNAAIVMHALGYSCPETWTARVPGNLFEGVEEQERPSYEVHAMSENRNHASEPTPAIDSGKFITDYFSSDDIYAYLTLDGTDLDALEKVTTETKKNVTYAEGYYGQGAVLEEGFIQIKEYYPENNSFTASLWINTTGSIDDPALFSNKYWSKGNSIGYAFYITGNNVGFNIGNGKYCYDAMFYPPADFDKGWMHIILTVDREAGTVGISFDFGEMQVVELPDQYKDISLKGPKNHLTLGQDGAGTYPYVVPGVYDEFMMFNRVFTQEDVAKLAEYYNAQ